MKILIVVCAIFFNFVLAIMPDEAVKFFDEKKIAFYGKFLLEDDYYKIVVQQNELAHQLFFAKNHTAMRLLEETSVAEGFLYYRIEQISKYDAPLLLTFWNKGVHGQLTMFFNLESGKKVFEKSSSWDVVVNNNKDSLEVVSSEELMSDGKYREQKTMWP